MQRKTCTHPGCRNYLRYVRAGLCDKHYKRLLKYGDPEVKLKTGPSVEKRVDDESPSDGCPWPATVTM